MSWFVDHKSLWCHRLLQLYLHVQNWQQCTSVLPVSDLNKSYRWSFGNLFFRQFQEPPDRNLSEPSKSLGIRSLLAAPASTSALVPGQGKGSRTRQEEISKVLLSSIPVLAVPPTVLQLRQRDWVWFFLWFLTGFRGFLEEALSASLQRYLMSAVWLS